MLRHRLGIVLAALVLGACGREVTLNFEGLVGDQAGRCGETYAGIGTTATEMTLGDYRVYIHDVRLVTTDGREIPVSLVQESLWQHEDVALLDFEDGTADCNSGTASTNARVVGTVSDTSETVGVRFRLGVPADLNHGDASTAPAPLNLTSMFWGWNGGYKFVRIEGRTTGLDTGFEVHLGSTGCMGDGRGNISSCVAENRAEIELTDFDPETDTIAFDVATLLSQSNMDVDSGGARGCLASFSDPDCEAVMHAFGLPFAGRSPTAPQRFVRVRSE